MRVFVTGGSGFIGDAVVAELVRVGNRVVGLARSEESAARPAASGVETVRGTLSDVEVLRAAAAGSDGVIHLAYGHGEPAEEAAGVDRRAITALDDALVGSDGPLVVTSGTLVLPAGRVGTETDLPDPGAPAAGRAGGRAGRRGTRRPGLRDTRRAQRGGAARAVRA